MYHKHSILHAVFATSIAVLVLASCKKSDDNTNTTATSPYGKVAVTFSNEVDGQPLNIRNTVYTNAAGNQYSVNALLYYITNFTLVKEDGTEKNFKNYKLVN